MTHLPTVTVVCVTTKDYGKSVVAIRKTLEQIQPFETLYFSDVPYAEDDRIQHILIDPFRSVEDYNHFIFKRLVDFVKSDHILVIQWDGYVIDGSAWRSEFLNYDYIGAPWTYTDGRNVGNGGFSLRSTHLHQVLQDAEFEYFSPEDEKIARYYRQTLEVSHAIKFAPESVAHAFSFEMHRPRQRTFGFHNYFHQPYKEPVVLKRHGAMGDIIMMEPLMEELHKQGHRVILDTPRHYFNLFAKHFFPIEHIDDLNLADTAEYRTINLDMAYEITPKQLVLKSYYSIARTQGEIRNSRLNFRAPENRSEVKLFDKYVVLHVDDTAMVHRNLHGLDWDDIAKYIELLGYPVFRVGQGNGQGGTKINTYSENMLGYVIANANFFIGLDSGCSQIAVACGVPSMIFFGSVNPAYRYADLTGITVMQKGCPIQKDGCYHSVISEVGVECEVPHVTPPCITWKNYEVIEVVKKFIV